jgi:hypothetical protein
MLYLVCVWSAMGAFVLSLAVYRKVVARGEDDFVHLGEAQDSAVSRQRSLAGRLEFIDKWGQMLTILTVVLGLILGSVYLYSGWMANAQLRP